MLGLTFKPNTDDIREAPALYLIENFLEEGAIVKVYDPEAMENVKNIYGDKIEYGSEPYDCLENADFLVLVTVRSPDCASSRIDTLRSGAACSSLRRGFPRAVEATGCRDTGLCRGP